MIRTASTADGVGSKSRTSQLMVFFGEAPLSVPSSRMLNFRLQPCTSIYNQSLDGVGSGASAVRTIFIKLGRRVVAWGLESGPQLIRAASWVCKNAFDSRMASNP